MEIEIPDDWKNESIYDLNDLNELMLICVFSGYKDNIKHIKKYINLINNKNKWGLSALDYAILSIYKYDNSNEVIEFLLKMVLM